MTHEVVPEVHALGVSTTSPLRKLVHTRTKPALSRALSSGTFTPEGPSQ